MSIEEKVAQQLVAWDFMISLTKAKLAWAEATQQQRDTWLEKARVIIPLVEADYKARMIERVKGIENPWRDVLGDSDFEYGFDEAHKAILKVLDG